jgi:hypothetical protein
LRGGSFRKPFERSEKPARLKRDDDGGRDGINGTTGNGDRDTTPVEENDLI